MPENARGNGFCDPRTDLSPLRSVLRNRCTDTPLPNRRSVSWMQEIENLLPCFQQELVRILTSRSTPQGSSLRIPHGLGVFSAKTRRHKEGIHSFEGTVAVAARRPPKPTCDGCAAGLECKLRVQGQLVDACRSSIEIVSHAP